MTAPAATRSSRARAARAELARRELQRRRHREDPVAWIEDRLGAHLWSRQQDIARSVAEHRYTAVQSCHGIGKDFLAARLVTWWIDSHPLGDAFAVTSAPSASQLETILWRELGRGHRDAKLPGRLSSGNVPMWRIGDEIVAVGRKPADLTDPEAAASAFSGIHARHVLIVLDEASGIEPWLWDAVDTLMTNANGRTLAIGNPLDGASRFARACAPGSGWNVIRVSAFETPAFTDEPVPDDLLELLVSPTWVEERRRVWGEGTPQWTARVLGEFPAAGTDTLIEPRWIRLAQEQALATEPGQGQAYGADIARSGDDRTVVYLAAGPQLRRVHRAVKDDTMATAGVIARLLNTGTEHYPGGMTTAWVDTIGVGAGVYDRLRENDHPVAAFVASQRAYDAQQFANRRAEAYWTLRAAFEEGRVDLDPADQELAVQLGAIRWKTTSRGAIQIESKDEMRRRGLTSPDDADAAVMAWWGAQRAGAPGIVSYTASANPITGDLWPSEDFNPLTEPW